MNDELLFGLRWVLMCDASTWRDELERILGPIGRDPGALEPIRVFLTERLSAADPTHRPRMEAVIGAIGEMIRGAAVTGADRFTEVAGRWIALERQAADAEAALAALRGEQRRVAGELRAMLAVGGARKVGALRFERTPDRRLVRVVDPTRVPLDCLRHQPDLDRLARKLDATGRVPEGCVVVDEPGELVVVHELDGPG